MVTGAGAVERARGREHEASHAGVAGGTGQAHGGAVVDVERQVGVDVAQWVVAQGGEVHDGVEAPAVLGLDVAHVEADRRHRRGRRTEHAVGVEAGVEADDLVAGVLQERHDERADVSLVAGHQDPHAAAAFPPCRPAAQRTKGADDGVLGCTYDINVRVA